MSPRRWPHNLIKRKTPPHILRKYVQTSSNPKNNHPPRYCEEAVRAKTIFKGFSEKDLASVTVLRPNYNNPLCNCRTSKAKTSTANSTECIATRADATRQDTQNPIYKIFVATGPRKNPVRDRLRILIKENNKLLKENMKRKGELEIMKGLREEEILRQQ